MYEKRTCIRTASSLLCRLPHECIIDDAQLDIGRTAQFRSECPSFFETDTVKSCLRNGFQPAEIIPISIYWDGVMYTKNDSFIGFYVENLYSKRKYLLATLRVRLSGFASCGCIALPNRTCARRHTCTKCHSTHPRVAWSTIAWSITHINCYSTPPAWSCYGMAHAMHAA
jgi:hypothetical protein